MADADWRRIESVVRPQRYALLVNDAHYWHYTAQRAIEVFTQLWGGQGFVIIPTDGHTIAEPFWSILESYSPDYIGKYIVTLPDLETADPEDYAIQMQRIRESIVSQGFPASEAEDYIRRNITDWQVNQWSLSDELKTELLDRLAPFHFSRTIDRHDIHIGSQPEYPFTQVHRILPNSKSKPSKVYRHKELSDPIFNLMAKMSSGAINDVFASDLEAAGIQVEDLPLGVTDKDYLDLLYRGDTSRLARITSPGATSLPQDFFEFLPRSLPMNSLTSYFRLEGGRIKQDNVTVVVGDTLEDFCFAFSLSRLLRNVYWLPDKPLQEAYTATQRMRQQDEAGEAVDTASETTLTVRSLVSGYVSKISFGSHYNEKLILTSFSLNKRQILSRQNKMLSLAYAGITNPQSSVRIRSAAEIDVTYVSRLMDTNNWANEQAMAFVDNESVERIKPVKPKGFNEIDPQYHRWIQTILIKGFRPPVLPSLGNEILKNHQSRYEVRTGKDGVAFLMPGIAYFAGNDIDTTLSKPEVKLLTSLEIFAHYFASNYLVFPSDKGNYFDDTVDKFGSLDEAAKFFKVKGYNELLNQFTAVKRSDEERRRDERIFLEYSSRAYLSLKQVRKALGSKHNASNVVDYLLSISVLRRGLILRCNKCSCSAWYDNANIGQDFECVRCRKTQLILKENWKHPDEPSWYYSLAETVHQFYEHNSHITLLALKHIKGDSEEFLYIPELELREMRDGGKRLEIDIACIKNGEIYFGEAKNRQLATTDLSRNGDLTKYINLHNLTQPKPFRVVFATNYNSVPSAVRTRIAASTIGKKTIYVLNKELYA
jgi:hypothetical protein